MRYSLPLPIFEFGIAVVSYHLIPANDRDLVYVLDKSTRFWRFISWVACARAQTIFQVLPQSLAIIILIFVTFCGEDAGLQFGFNLDMSGFYYFNLLAKFIAIEADNLDNQLHLLSRLNVDLPYI